MLDDEEASETVSESEELPFRTDTLLGRLRKTALEGSFKAESKRRRNLLVKQYEIIVQLYHDGWNEEKRKLFPEATELRDEEISRIEEIIDDPMRLADAMTQRLEAWEKAYDEETDQEEKEELALAIDAGRGLESQFLQEAQRSEHQK
jgi:hypothetical protein